MVLLKRPRVISFDVTGTLLVHRHPIAETYSEAATWAKLSDPPSANDLKSAFKKAYHFQSTAIPCFGKNHRSTTLSSRQWWEDTVRLSLKYTNREYSKDDFNRYFRRIYQHYGSPNGYKSLPDATTLLQYLTQSSNHTQYQLGITTNTPFRTVETVLPMLGLHEPFQWFVCCEDIGFEKPQVEIFNESFRQACYRIPDLRRDEVLHVGDSIMADYCGAKAAGFQALYLHRDNSRPGVTNHQRWEEAPHYPNKSEEDIKKHTITSLLQIIEILEK